MAWRVPTVFLSGTMPSALLSRLFFSINWLTRSYTNGEKAISMDVILLGFITTGLSFSLSLSLSLSYFLSFCCVLVHVHVLRLFIAPDGRVVKGKMETTTNACQVRERETRMMCRGHSHRRMYYKKAFTSLSPFFSYLLLFFGTFLPSLSRSSPRRRPRPRPYRRSTILEPQCFLSVPCLFYCFVRAMRERERESEKRE